LKQLYIETSHPAMHKLTTFQNIAYATATHADGTPHFFNDEAFFSEFYRLVLNPDQDVIDVGFNIGMQTELLRPLTSGTIYGFEASPQIFQHAHERFKDDVRIRLFHRAVSDICGTVRFIDTDYWGAGSLRRTQGMDYCNVGDAYTEIDVEATTLDATLSDLNNVGLIKLDIEGAEIACPCGRNRTHRPQPPLHRHGVLPQRIEFHDSATPSSPAHFAITPAKSVTQSTTFTVSAWTPSRSGKHPFSRTRPTSI